MPSPWPTVLARIDTANQRRPWSHNAAYARWVVRRLPRRTGLRALDIGCGTGDLLTRLAPRCASVVGVDRDARVLDEARAALAGVHNVELVVGDLADLGTLGSFDVVTAVAVLHHVDLAEGLDRLLAALRPGGRLLVVGCFAEESVADRVVSAVAVPANLLVGLVRAPRGRPQPISMTAPTRPATSTLREIRAQALVRLPGARIRRRLFWRYTLVFTLP